MSNLVHRMRVSAVLPAFLFVTLGAFGQAATAGAVVEAAGEEGECYELSEEEGINRTIYQTLNEAVVNITSVSVSYNWFMQPVPQEGTGSGSIMDQEGRVLTNYHVVKGAEELTIRLADGSEYPGELVGADPYTDLAVVQFDSKGKKLVTIAFGCSDDLFVGQRVLAIGNPFGLDRTLTTGIISALGRPIETSEGIVLREMIQTDASINPGNSGGPLLDTRGRIIGVNTMIYSPSGGSVGIGFAVPIDRVMKILPELLQHGKLIRGWIDIAPIQLTDQFARYVGLSVSEGLLITQVKPGSPAEASGLRGGSRAVRFGRSVVYLGGDVIVEVKDQMVATIGDLYAALEDTKPGDRVSVTVVRNGSRKTLGVMLSAQE